MDHDTQHTNWTTYPVVSPLFFSRQLQQFGRANLDAGVSAFTALARSVCEWQSEVAQFASKRLDRNADYARRLIEAKDTRESLSVQAEYLRTAAEDYAHGAQRLMECGVQASKEVMTPVEQRSREVATEAYRAGSRHHPQVRGRSVLSDVRLVEHLGRVPPGHFFVRTAPQS